MRFTSDDDDHASTYIDGIMRPHSSFCILSCVEDHTQQRKCNAVGVCWTRLPLSKFRWLKEYDIYTNQGHSCTMDSIDWKMENFYSDMSIGDNNYSNYNSNNDEIFGKDLDLDMNSRKFVEGENVL